MTFARIRLIVAAAALLGWLGWLGYAVTLRGSVPLVSRAQLAGTTHLVVAELTADPKQPSVPAADVKVLDVLRGEGPSKGVEVGVLNLPSAGVPGGGFPGPGTYLLPLDGNGRTFRVAGLPRSPGYEETTPARPLIYPWTDDVKAQLRELGILNQ